MRALILNCTLKPSSEESSTERGKAWTYRNMGPGPGPCYLLATARALAASPIPAPPS